MKVSKKRKRLEARQAWYDEHIDAGGHSKSPGECRQVFHRPGSVNK